MNSADQTAAAHPPPPHAEVDLVAAATAPKSRSLAPDLARGLMLLLIALANVPWWLYGIDRPMTSGHQLGQTGADLAWQLFSLVTIDGRAYPLFAFLFGHGIWQSYSRQAASGAPWRSARALLQRRHAWMIAFGAVHALLLFYGDVVGAYGLVGLLVTWILLRRTDKTLRIVAIAMASLVLLVAFSQLVFGALATSGVLGDLAPYSGGSSPPPVAGMSHYLQFSLYGFALWMGLTVGQLIFLLVPLSAILGIFAARRGLLDRPADHKRALVRIAVFGILIGWAGGALAAAQHAGALFAPEVSYSAVGAVSLTGVAGGVGYAAAFALLVVAIGQRRGAVSSALAAVGKRSLTSYLLQSVMFAPLMAAWGLGLGGVLGPLQAAGLAVVVWLVTVVVAVLLERAGKRGPAEALLRRLAYGKKPVAAPSAVT